MLPGDYIAMKMTGQIKTTPSGLSEGIMWDFEKDGLAEFVLENYGISTELVAETVPTFSVQGELTSRSCERAGAGSRHKGQLPGRRPAEQRPVAERFEAGRDRRHSGHLRRGLWSQRQKELRPEIAGQHLRARQSFTRKPRYGVLLCLNGTGILNSWLKHNFVAARAGLSANE